MNEEWRPIPGYDDAYEASSLGQIRSLKGRAATRPISRCLDGSGYLVVNLRESGSKRIARVSRLVLLAFHGHPTGDSNHAAHLNGNRTDNRLSNLKWVTPLENASHKELHGTVGRGETWHRAKVSEADVRAIRERSRLGESQSALAAEYGLTQGAISKIQHRRHWRHVA